MFKKLHEYIQRNFATRVALWVVLFATLVFLVVMSILFTQSRRAVRVEAMLRAEQVLDNTVQRVNTILDRVEVATNNTDWLIGRHLDAPDSMYVYSRRIVENNPFLDGCSIAFEPYYFKDRGKYFSAYSGFHGDKIETRQEGSDRYEYFTMDWYQLVKLLGHPSWTEPYSGFSEGLDDTGMIASYCKPLRDKDGTYIGTIAVDLSLGWLSETISSVKPYPHSYSIMTGLGGTFFVHPDSTKLFYQSIFTQTMIEDDPELYALGKAMQRGESGNKRMIVSGEPCYVFYKPLADTGWSAAIVCPETDIFAGLNHLQKVVFFLFLIGIVLMLIVCTRIVSREMKPLSQLTHQIETISSGQLDQKLPDNGRTDELGRLYQSFNGMQQSLISYIEEMKQTTAAKASIENELKVASDIQMSMVPRIFPAFPNRKDIDLYATMCPAKEVGGDLYDYFVQDEKLYFCVGDVSGKGIPASLFMAVTRNLFRIFAQQGHSPESIATAINQFLSQDNNQLMFVTMFLGQIDLKTGRMEFCNCGHNPPVLVAPGEKAIFLPVKYTNQPLGILEGLFFKGESLDDMRSKLFLLYTDGLNEAENPKQEQFGDDAILKIMTEAGDQTSDEVILRLKRAVEVHRDGAAPNDDLTLVCLRLL